MRLITVRQPLAFGLGVAHAHFYLYTCVVSCCTWYCPLPGLRGESFGCVWVRTGHRSPLERVEQVWRGAWGVASLHRCARRGATSAGARRSGRRATASGEKRVSGGDLFSTPTRVLLSHKQTPRGVSIIQAREVLMSSPASYASSLHLSGCRVVARPLGPAPLGREDRASTTLCHSAGPGRTQPWGDAPSPSRMPPPIAVSIQYTVLFSSRVPPLAPALGLLLRPPLPDPSRPPHRLYRVPASAPYPSVPRPATASPHCFPRHSCLRPALAARSPLAQRRALKATRRPRQSKSPPPRPSPRRSPRRRRG